MSRVAQHPVQGFIAALGAVAVLSVMDAVMKHLVLAIGIIAVSVWRSAANLLLSLILYRPSRVRWPEAKVLRVHLLRGAVLTVMAALFFWGIGRVPLAQAIALTFIAPLIAMFLAALMLGEKVGRNSIAGSLVAFAGVIAIVLGQARSHAGPDVLLGTAAIMLSALCYAFNIVLMRRQALAAAPLEINFFQGATILALWLLALPFVGMPAWPAEQLQWIAVASLLSTAGTLLFAWGYARGPASYLAATEYSGFIWASILGWLVFREHVSMTTLGGAALIVGGCLIAARGKVTAPPEIDLAA
ncbi:DMT family transporter [Sphingomonas flavescens]|uniref:DMT family transporter n=1 Tax=Sphingomonas flavescens TaxID=3132797 RepID=UPI002803F491|nr:DMT family transporter [Sphingomonas limnosediminicola]